jgi:hypothetical protein
MHCKNLTRKATNRLDTSENLERVQEFREANWMECHAAESIFKPSIVDHVCT